jgi:hypothetical protein
LNLALTGKKGKAGIRSQADNAAQILMASWMRIMVGIRSSGPPDWLTSELQMIAMPELSALHSSSMLRGRRKSLFRYLFILAGILLLATSFPVRAAALKVNYTGHYEMADPKANRTFLLDLTQVHSRVKASFSAAMSDGTGAAPKGTGKGHFEDGVLSFDFTDNYHNEGSCTFAPLKGGYQLSMRVVKLGDMAPLHFYGTVLLRKTSDKPKP